MGKITLTNIAEELAHKSGLSKDAADNFMRAFVETIEKGLQEDNIVKIKGLGTFKLIEVSDRGSVDVNTGERITIKGYTKVTFTPDSSMKEFVNRPFAHFEPTELNDGYSEEDVTIEVETVDSSYDDKLSIEDKVIDLSSDETENETSLEIVVSALETETEPTEVEIAESQEEIIVQEKILAPQEEVVESQEKTADSHQEEFAESQRAPAKLQTKSKGCMGWGCLFAILIAAAVGIGIYYYITPTKNIKVSDEQSEILVNPNLEKDLEEEWNNTPEASNEESEDTLSLLLANNEEAKETTGTDTDSSSASIKTMHSSVTATIEKEVPVITLDANTDYLTLIITETLAAKTIKDITMSDTTDYIIDGTLTIHSLKSGETIIQLARMYYGDKRLWPYIVKYNQITDFNKVAIGMSINIPLLKNKTLN